MNFSNTSKTVIQKQIKQKQALFNRFKKRYNVTSNPSERSFLKTEAVRISSELKQCSRQWTNCGFGGTTWITKNYSTSNFNSANCGRRTSTRSTSSSRTTRGNRNMRRSTSASRSNRSSSARRSYVAW